MISFRYHVVSLIAVFLALGMGALFGVSFLDEKTVQGLEAQQQRLGARNKELRDEISVLESTNRGLTRSFELTKAGLIKGALQDAPPIFLVHFDSSRPELIDQISQSIQQADGRVAARFVLKDSLEAPASRAKLAALLNVEQGEKAVSDSFAAQMSAALRAGQLPLIQSFASSGLIEVSPPSGEDAVALTSLPYADAAFVFVASRRPGGPMDEHFTWPLIRSLANSGALIAAAEPGVTDLELLAPLRGDGSLRIVTADGVDAAHGQIALVLGIGAGARGTFGHYGIGPGATAPLPQPMPTG